MARAVEVLEPTIVLIENVPAVTRDVGKVVEQTVARLRACGYAVADAPFAHLKVMVVDVSAAYIGSANITAAGLGGRNLELGVLVRGTQVTVIGSILDLYQETL
jgi:phosphatidylserine/phosphatidylglycerophosphate/cardiolipin synthase-like enzyme